MTEPINQFDSQGRQHGIWEEYYSGILWKTKKYLKGELHGEQKEYYTDGRLLSIKTYEMGVRSGLTIGYYEDGQVSWKGQYLNGRRHKYWEWFNWRKKPTPRTKRFHLLIK